MANKEDMRKLIEECLESCRNIERLLKKKDEELAFKKGSPSDGVCSCSEYTMALADLIGSTWYLEEDYTYD